MHTAHGPEVEPTSARAEATTTMPKFRQATRSPRSSTRYKFEPTTLIFMSIIPFVDVDELLTLVHVPCP